MTQRKPSRLLIEQLEDRLTPSANEIPAGQFNWTQVSPSGTLTQLVWQGQALEYQTWNGTSWQSQTVTTSTTFTQTSYTTRDQMMTAAQTAQLVFTTNGTANVLVLGEQWESEQDGYQTEIYDYVPSSGGAWKLNATLTPPQLSLYGPNNLVAEPGPDNSISLIVTQTSVEATAPGAEGTGSLWYGTNQSGKWVYSQIATTADLSDDVWVEGARYAPRFLSLAVTASGAAYVTYTPEFYVSAAFGTVDSTLMLATNASGSWQSQTVVAPANGGPADAALAASVAVAPDGQVAVASYYVERNSSGSDVASWLDYSTLNSNGAWTTTPAVTTPDGYVAGDGPNYTGFDPELTFNAQSVPTIVFTDVAAQHLALTYENEYSGQIRTTTLQNGSWVTTTVLAQTNPLVNQLMYPVAVTYEGQTVYAGLVATSTLDSNDNIVSTSFSPTDVFLPVGSVPPVSPPPVSPPPVSPPVSPPPVVVPPVSPPPIIVSPPASPPPVTVNPPPPVSPSPPASPPPPIPVMAAVTASGATTEIRVTYSNGATYTWDPFGSSYKAGATVAIGDVTGSGYPDIIVASGNSGTAGTVQVYDGLSRKLVASYEPMGTFGGGLDVAVGDVQDIGRDDIVVGVLGGGSPVVAVLNGTNGSLVDEFLAYAGSFMGGVRLAAADVNGDGYADVIVAPGKNANGRAVEVYSGQSVATGTGAPTTLTTFVPFPAYNGAVDVAAGDLTSGGPADIVVSTQSTGEELAVYSWASLTAPTPTPLFRQDAWATVDDSGLSVALVPSTGSTGLDDLIVTDGSGSRAARYTAADFSHTSWPVADAQYFTPLPGVTAPVYVG